MNSSNHNSGSSRQGPILVAVDFSADSKAALTWAFEVADWMQTSVLVLHVVHDSSVAPDYYK
ncbi:MAG: universal stress protein, partial [Arenicellales bacterium]|nr:universal stress protein [Arenicellales bacterium]